jgi:hypothetical protein
VGRITRQTVNAERVTELVRKTEAACATLSEKFYGMLLRFGYPAPSPMVYDPFYLSLQDVALEHDLVLGRDIEFTPPE